TVQTRPLIPRSVAIQFNAIAVRIAQVDGFADAVIGRAFDGHAVIEQALESARQLEAVRIKNREVIKPGASGRRRRGAFASPGVQCYLKMLATRREKDRA